MTTPTSNTPEGTPEHDRQWDDICTAMEWIREALGVPIDPDAPDILAEAYRNAARALQGQGDEVEVDDNAPVHPGEGGAFVQAWLWVPNADAGICAECGQPGADNGGPQHGICSECADKDEGKAV